MGHEKKEGDESNMRGNNFGGEVDRYSKKEEARKKREGRTRESRAKQRRNGREGKSEKKGKRREGIGEQL